MKTTFTEKQTTWLTGGIILLSLLFLFGAEQFFLSHFYPGQWDIAFVQPLKNDLTFTINNQSDCDKFQYVLIANEKTIANGTLTISSGEKQEIKKEIFPTNFSPQGKIIIRLSDCHQKTLEIFKIFP